MTPERLQSIGASFLISLAQFEKLPQFPLSVLPSTHGKDGKEWATESIATLMQWYDTLSEKEKVKCWTLIVDFFMLPTPLGEPSHVSNSSSVKWKWKTWRDTAPD
jgi:hypothetical protein